jgi:ATP-dependent Clp protease protease subunit
MKTLTLIGEVGEEIYAGLVSEMLEEAGGEDIYVKLSTPGGSISDGITIYNLFRQYDGHVIIENIGYSVSAGALIMQAANERVVARASLTMMHFGRLIAEDGSETTEDMVEDGPVKQFMNTANRTIFRIFSERTGLNGEVLLDLLAKEYFMTSEEAVRMGFADRVSEENLTETVENLAAVSTELYKLKGGLLMSQQKEEEVQEVEGPVESTEEETELEDAAPEEVVSEEGDEEVVELADDEEEVEVGDVAPAEAVASIDTKRLAELRAKFGREDGNEYFLDELDLGGAALVHLDKVVARKEKLEKENAVLKGRLEAYLEGVAGSELFELDQSAVIDDQAEDNKPQKPKDIRAAWEANEDGCQDKFKNIIAYKGYVHNL